VTANYQWLPGDYRQTPHSEDLKMFTNLLTNSPRSQRPEEPAISTRAWRRYRRAQRLAS